ncbi:thiamine biosynthesis protein ThiI [Paenibacillus sp. 1_12]|uniref:tRNA uracil 4-sulfurtransferase ThiI n=1 Tax=Paenibacillus sp. 1_12 TaxID=1566278 RepID=UPI0008E1A1D2|nr:tRNA uracil 4-sulfurtransferase ThiI [Paenibacillus sp. 1_12]SFL32339.1 thiamine biosynthesis protein ThiI [Paenibacillus sp. 1_12]
MKPNMIMLRLGELTLKGKNRSKFEKVVFEQVKKSVQSFSRLTFVLEFGRVYIHLNEEPYEVVQERLRKVLGLSSFSPVYTAPLELEAIQSTALAAMEKLDNGQAEFKVTVRRVNKKFPYDSQEMNKLVAGFILKAIPGLRVNVNQPEVELKVELREKQALIFSNSITGVGGFPLGTNGKAMLMLSGGIDSPVAGFLALRQGLKLDAVHFHSFPYTSERSQQKVKELTAKLCGYAGDIRLHMVPFTSIQTRIHEVYKEDLFITLLRRAMFRITEKLAENYSASAIVTGESLGQVASQTIYSMNVIGRAVEIPIIQPLICMEKKEIIRVAEDIDTFEISILPYEDCCTLFMPPYPSTNPSLRIVESIEKSMDWLDAELDEAVRLTEQIWIKADEKTEFAALF